MSQEEFEQLPEVQELAAFAEKFKEFFTSLEKGFLQFASLWKLWLENKNAWFEFLGSHGWLLTDEMPISAGLQQNSRGSDIEDKLERAFSKLLDSQKFVFLDKLATTWETNSHAARRYSIIHTCLHLYKRSNSEINYYQAIIPTLLTQIEGLRSDCLIVASKKNASLEQLLKDLATSGNARRQGELQSRVHKFIELSELNRHGNRMYSLFINDILYERLYFGQKASAFNRHKILHGENLTYGTKANAMKLFLAIDFLVNLLDEIEHEPAG